MGEERKRVLEMLAKGTVTAEEAEKLLDALGTTNGGTVKEDGPSAIGPRNPKFLRVKVASNNGDNVDVRVPMALIRAGMKLTALIPPQAAEKINSKMHEKGLAFDLNSLKAEDIETLTDSLGEMQVNVASKNGDAVRVFCE
jgi:hypothetical protein